MLTKQQIQFDVGEAIRALDALDIFVLNFVLHWQDVTLSMKDVTAALGITEEEFDQLFDRATKRLKEALQASVHEENTCHIQ